MSLFGKIFSVLCLVLAVFYAGVTVSLLTYQENYKRQFERTNAKHKIDLENKDVAIADLDGQKKALESRRVALEGSLARAQGENVELRGEWATMAAALQNAMNLVHDQEAAIKSLDKNRADLYGDLVAKGEMIKKREGEIADIKGTLAATQTKRDGFQDLLTEREKDLVNAEKTMDQLTEAIKWRNDKIEWLKEKRPDIWKEMTEAGGVEGILPVGNIRGKVVGVDRKLGLVILNVGQKQHVRKGFPFIVFRESQYVGKVIVEDVTTPDTCAARYSKPDMKTDAEVGDDVALRLMVEF